MCTIIVLDRVDDEYPLIVAANRDESFVRPSTPPEMLQVLPVAVIAPLDLRSGGTWFGAAQGGWFACLTNQDDSVTELRPRSRGEVVKECLMMGDHGSVARYIDQLDPLDFNPFNLVFGRPGAVFLARVHHDKPVDICPLFQGVNIVTNDTSGERCASREAHVRQKMFDVTWPERTIEETRVDLWKVLSTHLDDDQSPCLHDRGDGFGTVSTSLITVSKSGLVEYFYSEGRPCCASPVLVGCLGTIT